MALPSGGPMLGSTRTRCRALSTCRNPAHHEQLLRVPRGTLAVQVRPRRHRATRPVGGPHRRCRCTTPIPSPPYPLHLVAWMKRETSRWSHTYCPGCQQGAQIPSPAPGRCSSPRASQTSSPVLPGAVRGSRASRAGSQTPRGTSDPPGRAPRIPTPPPSATDTYALSVPKATCSTPLPRTTSRRRRERKPRLREDGNGRCPRPGRC